MNELTEAFLAAGRSVDCPVINTHAHFGPYKAIYFPRSAPERVIEMMEGAGIRWLIAAAHEALTDTERGNRNYAATIARYPDRLKGYWAINPLYPERVKQEVAEYEQFPGFIGFKFLSDYYAYPITGDSYKPALEYADEHRLPILLHTWGGSAFDGPALWPQVAEAYPHVTFLMGHAGFGEWQRASEVARDYPNVYLELTAAYSVRGAVNLMVDIAGSRKITFGDDHPWFDPRYGIGCILFSRLTEDACRDILYRNAQQIFQLPQ